MLLVLDTATPACTAALFDHGGARIAGFDEVMSRGHAERLMPLLDTLLAGKMPDAILVGCGPGSFTGLRVGIAAAQGLSIGWKVPLLGFATTALLAASVPGSDPVAVALIGGHGELFVQEFSRSPWQALAPVASLAPAAAAAVIRSHQVAGPGAAALVEARGFGEAVDVLPTASSALRLPTVLREAPPKPIYARAPDAKPKAA